MNKSALSILRAVLLLVVVNIVSTFFYTRLDMTEDRRYSLSQPAINTVSDLESPMIVDVLLAGNLTPEFLRLQTETRYLLEEFAELNENIKFNFINPLDGEEEVNGVITDLQSLGLTPTRVTTGGNTSVSQDIVFPWAMVNYRNSTAKVPLLKNKLGTQVEERINNSVQQLEYAFADAFTKVRLKEKKRVAVIKGNGELDDIFMADFLSTLREYYNLGAITLDSVVGNPQKTLDDLSQYDLALIAKPTQAFTDQEKYVLDQFVIQGGKSIWLIDPVAMELDSLFNASGTAMALPRDLNLNDFFFNYGVRINHVLVNDLYFTQIVLASGEGNNSQYDPVPWYYNPMVFSKNNHPINNNLEAIRFQFTAAMDTLPNANAKSILLQSSPLSKVDGTPRPIRLDMLKTPPDKNQYVDGNKPLAVLIEGRFNSAFSNRVKPAALRNPLEQGIENKMLVISDGDLIKNQLRNGRPLELGYDKWTNNFYGNKEFLVNAFNYLLDDTGLINIRNKKVAIPLLDTNKIAAEKIKWQLVNIGVPILLTLIFGFVFSYWRKRKYAS